MRLRGLTSAVPLVWRMVELRQTSSSAPTAEFSSRFGARVSDGQFGEVVGGYTGSLPISDLDMMADEQFGSPMHVSQSTSEADPNTSDARATPSGLVTAGTCFGYAIQAPRTFTSLRQGSGTALTLREDGTEPEDPGEPLFHWTDDGRDVVRLYVENDRYRLWMDGGDWFSVDPGQLSITSTRPVDDAKQEARALGFPAALCFMHRGDLAMHASGVDVEGSALLFAAPGLHGKTTLAGAFVREGFRLLSEDTTCYRPGLEPAALPGLAMLRIRRDVYEQLEMRHTTVVREDPDRVFLSVDQSLRGDSSPVPIRGVVFLRRSEDDDIRIERIPAERAFPDLWSLIFRLPYDEDRARCFAGIAELSRSVPIWNLHRRFSIEELPSLVDRLVSTCTSA